MKFLICILTMSSILGCINQPVQERLPAFDGSVKQSGANCLQEFAEAKKQVVEFLEKNKNFLKAEENQRILSSQNEFQVQCVQSIVEKSNFQVDRNSRKIYFDSSLKNTEALFELAFAKEQLENLKIEVRAITFDQLFVATALQSLHDSANTKDERMNYYFQYLKSQQAEK